MAFHWKCPFCCRDTTITKADSITFTNHLNIENSVGDHILTGLFTVCPNGECKKYTLQILLGTTKTNPYGVYMQDKLIKKWSLIPASKAQVFPNYIPKAISIDYEEACSIISGSPKASATLSRRCLQGMIRNFWDIKRPSDHKGNWTLMHEIDAIREKVEPETWDAIDSVRKIGNIGAHMEEDINVIV